MHNFMQEFKQFIARGNVVDLAVGVIVGAAFQKIVSSLVGDVVLPVIGMFSGNVDFTSIHAGPIAIGNFIQTSVDFIIVAFIVFLAVKSINSLKRKSDADGADKLSKQEALLVEIRDLLKKS